MEQILTPAQQQREQRNRAVYTDYLSLTAQGNMPKMLVLDALMRKYNIFTPATIYKIIKSQKGVVEA
jgi:hypothetical protein